MPRARDLTLKEVGHVLLSSLALLLEAKQSQTLMAIELESLLSNGPRDRDFISHKSIFTSLLRVTYKGMFFVKTSLLRGTQKPGFPWR